MKIQHLILVSGRSFEQITDLLNDTGIEFKLKYPPHQSDHHFRESVIRIHREDKARTEQLLGKAARNTQYSSFYYAEYKIEPNFDWTILSGNPNFRKGLLVESTGVEYRS
jgi:hypothetical protein